MIGGLKFRVVFAPDFFLSSVIFLEGSFSDELFLSTEVGPYSID